MVKKFAILFFLMLILAFFSVVLYELYACRIQAFYFSEFASKLTYQIEKGPNENYLNSPSGPYDKRLGYSYLDVFAKKLIQNRYRVEKHTRISGEMKLLSDHKLFPVYHEKTQAGLKIYDQHNLVILLKQYPERVFRSFAEIPTVLLNMLLFIEDRHLLDSARPFLNPAVDWIRLSGAILEKGKQLITPELSVSGGSTLATQLEKYRHSKKGITNSFYEKLIQMISASLRAYLGGPRTFDTRRQVVLDYINSIPLAARSNYGEIFGLEDGLWIWYGREPNEVMDLFLTKKQKSPLENSHQKPLALKQVLSMLIANKRPTDFLLKDTGRLEEKCNEYLRLLSENNIVPKEIVRLALQIPIELCFTPPNPVSMNLVERKSVDCIRVKLLSLLGVSNVYDLDRMDLTVKSTLDLPAQTAITKKLLKLHSPEYLKKMNLMGKHLLAVGEPAKVVYSFTLFEKTPKGNALRVQTDTFDQPFNINEGTKLNLGSTAKLRTLIHYLEIVADLYERHHRFNNKELKNIKPLYYDKITRWIISYLSTAGNHTLKDVLEAAMKRPFSANPHAAFFTGGGVHRFENFNPKDNNRIITVREGFRRSVNLVFIRLMREIVYHHMYGEDSSRQEILKEKNHPDRNVYLQKFAEYEGTLFLHRYYRKYQNKSGEEAFQLLLKSVEKRCDKLAAVFRAVFPDKTSAEFRKFLQQHVRGMNLNQARLDFLCDKYAHQEWSFSDLGYISDVHPVELWLVGFLQQHPKASVSTIKDSSKEIIQATYGWLFRTSSKVAQNRRIKTIFEHEAFKDIHRAWARLGFPFEQLVPSYATAIGSSADRPNALAELMGIVLNQGIRKPMYRIDKVAVGKGTPYETHFEYRSDTGEKVLRPEIADVIKNALFDVVKNGSASRAQRSFIMFDNQEMPVGGKTGTGDHQYKTFNHLGELTSSRAMNRSATFSFIIGDRFFGNITAYVPGTDAGEFAFTSSFPVAIFKQLAKYLKPLVESVEKGHG